MNELDAVKFLTFLLLIFLNGGIVRSAAKNINYQQLNFDQGLYTRDDNVFVLNATNFNSSVHGGNSAWFVEFYNSWCGFCQRFAPLWKNLAGDVLAWQDLVVVAAIDCANDDNNPICRNCEIMQYPTLKYFSLNPNPSSLGIVIEKSESLQNLRKSLVNRMVTEQQAERGSTWPNITPYRGMEVNHIWQASPASVKYVFIIFEDKNSSVGIEVILDLHKLTDKRIRKVTSDNELLCVMYKITKFPSLVVFGRNNLPKTLNLQLQTRESIGETIKNYPMSKEANINEKNSEKTENQIINIKSNESLELGNNKSNNIQVPDYLYQMDLETTLRYSLKHEVSGDKIIRGKQMEALKLYIDVLASFFPSRNGNNYLKSINESIGQKNEITGEEFSRLLDSNEQEIPWYSGPPKWIGCKGSSEGFRGYPCGLWTLFHTLTVNFALKYNDQERFHSEDVLKAIYAYISNFFGCSDCRQHFEEMAIKNQIFNTRNVNESILWLWRSHNEVNARLSNDKTEDPKHRKFQYPSRTQCPLCRFDNESWDESQVLMYLEKKYRSCNIKNEGFNQTQQMDRIESLKSRAEMLVAGDSSFKKIGWDFNVFDLSICVILYITSALILVFVCVKFAFKRRYRKKVYVNFLGKV